MFIMERSILGNPGGPIFLLKNMGLSDNQTVNQISADGSMSPKPVIVNHAKEKPEQTNKEMNKLVVELQQN